MGYEFLALDSIVSAREKRVLLLEGAIEDRSLTIEVVETGVRRSRSNAWGFFWELRVFTKLIVKDIYSPTSLSRLRACNYISSTDINLNKTCASSKIR